MTNTNTNTNTNTKIQDLLSEAKVGDVFMTESKGPAQLVKIFGGSAGYDFYVQGKIRIYTYLGDLSSFSNLSKDVQKGFKLTHKITRETNPEYYL